MDCSCPDWGLPCKHVAAVCYLLAESFDDDPFRILAWRGREREDLLENLRALRSSTTTIRAAGAGTRVAALVDCLDAYFRPAAPIPAYQPSQLPPDAVLRQLPPLSLEVRGIAVVDLLRPAYLRMARDSAPVDSALGGGG
jgi:uncharacterized Zn finger protein